MVAGVASHGTSDTVQVSFIIKAPGVVGRDLAMTHVSSVKVADEPEGTTAHIFLLRQYCTPSGRLEGLYNYSCR